jgi:excisionase family DNA binding protein
MEPSMYNQYPGLPPYLTPQEYADLLSVDRKTVYSAIERGELRVVRVGRTLRIPRDEVMGKKKGGGR